MPILRHSRAYVMTVTQGMAVQAAGGASRADLLLVADMALKAWPQ